MTRKLGLCAAAAGLALAAGHDAAHAFCGFYVSGSGEKMFADATEVVLMRNGTRTVLSMQNDFKGPLEDFAMVVPVPVVLHEKDVKTLPKEVFAHVDALGSPRLVEYWEQDPCPRPIKYESMKKRPMREMAPEDDEDKPASRKDTVKIEAKFDIAEYKILILSATDSSGLERWLTANHYKIPEGAAPLLRPYVEGGSKFFVAKVDPKKVQMVGGHAALSPLRFHYDSEEFALPIRLGMANSGGTQDLIVNIISADKRFEVANYKNAFIPTNFDLKESAKGRFPEFYAALFDKTVETHPGAVITEYAWTAVPNYHCDPCTNADVSNPDLMTLGGDVVGGQIAAGTFVLTRLHARYGKLDMKDDLRFTEAKPVTGGREISGPHGLETGAQPSTQNYFQARYAIRHAWTGPIACKNPQRGIWGPPTTQVAQQLAFAPRGKLQLASVVTKDIPELHVKRASAPPAATPNKFATPPASSPKVKAMGLGAGVLGAIGLIGALSLLRRRR